MIDMPDTLVVGCMAARNEDWCIGLSARVALLWCDNLVVYQHACTDRTQEILHELDAEQPGKLCLTTDPDDCWSEMQHRQQMLNWARDICHATHVAIVDADEILSADSLPYIRPEIESLASNAMLYTRLLNMRGTPYRYHINGIWGNRHLALAFKDVPEARWSGDTFHHREPHGIKWRMAFSQCKVLHLWGVTERRLLARHALYKLTERLRWPNKPVSQIDAQYNLAIRCSPDQPEWRYADTLPAWTDKYEPWMAKYLDLEREPWQEQESRKLVAAYPGIATGLNLFGVA